MGTNWGWSELPFLSGKTIKYVKHLIHTCKTNRGDGGVLINSINSESNFDAKKVSIMDPMIRLFLFPGHKQFSVK